MLLAEKYGKAFHALGVLPGGVPYIRGIPAAKVLCEPEEQPGLLFEAVIAETPCVLDKDGYISALVSDKIARRIQENLTQESSAKRASTATESCLSMFQHGSGRGICEKRASTATESCLSTFQRKSGRGICEKRASTATESCPNMFQRKSERTTYETSAQDRAGSRPVIFLWDSKETSFEVLLHVEMSDVWTNLTGDPEPEEYFGSRPDVRCAIYLVIHDGTAGGEALTKYGEERLISGKPGLAEENVATYKIDSCQLAYRALKGLSLPEGSIWIVHADDKTWKKSVTYFQKEARVYYEFEKMTEGCSDRYGAIKPFTEDS